MAASASTSAATVRTGCSQLLLGTLSRGGLPGSRHRCCNYHHCTDEETHSKRQGVSWGHSANN
ncbi:hypothetical protein I79_026023 [Cricetulus griseus]|uniref:Uncharacterized protein n=1 Tax=Cricetulus griseus TaxID=10029 RepID=G3IPU5_CRIGR|nr:hypothetical protein I79_026023 [Cricetulus griseus]